MGCGVCVGVCPVNALAMVPQESASCRSRMSSTTAVAKVSEKKDMQDNTVKGSQFKQPMLEFSGSCAGCAETSLMPASMTQLFGDRMYISNATGCSSIWGGPGATSPYCTNKEGHGPAWSNSLFEDNAEHGLGMYTRARTSSARAWPRRSLPSCGNTSDEARKAVCQDYLDTMDDGVANQAATTGPDREFSKRCQCCQNRQGRSWPRRNI